MVLLTAGMSTPARSCSGFATPVNPATGALIGHGNMHCTSTPGPSAATTTLRIALLAFFVLGSILSAVYLARRARDRPALVGAPGT